MTEQEIREWITRNNEPHLSEEEIDHVAMCLDHLSRWFYEGYPVGDFLKSVIANDLMEAVARADSTNLKGLKLYMYFTRNHLPYDWNDMKKAKIRAMNREAKIAELAKEATPVVGRNDENL